MSPSLSLSQGPSLSSLLCVPQGRFPRYQRVGGWEHGELIVNQINSSEIFHTNVIDGD